MSYLIRASWVAQNGKKDLSTMRETWVWSLGWEDPVEKGMATLSSILAWRIPWTEDPGGLHFFFFFFFSMSHLEQKMRQEIPRDRKAPLESYIHQEVRVYWRE